MTLTLVTGANGHIGLRQALIVVALFLSMLSGSAWAVCAEPYPYSIPLKVFKKGTVAVARVLDQWDLLETETWNDPKTGKLDSETYTSGWIWHVKAEEALLGCKVGDVLAVYSENASDRYQLEVGRTYLLYMGLDTAQANSVLNSKMTRFAGIGRRLAKPTPRSVGKLFEIGGCAENLRSDEKAFSNALQEVRDSIGLNATGGKGTLQILVSKWSPPDSAGATSLAPLAGAALIINGAGKSISVTTDKAGGVEIQVAAGHYSVDLLDHSLKAEPSSMTWDDFRGFDLVAGGGAGVAIEAKSISSNAKVGHP